MDLPGMDNPQMIELRSGELNLHALLDAAQHDGQIVIVLRYKKRAAVVVPGSWFDQAQAALAREAGNAGPG